MLTTSAHSFIHTYLPSQDVLASRPHFYIVGLAPSSDQIPESTSLQAYLRICMYHNLVVCVTVKILISRGDESFPCLIHIPLPSDM